MSCTTVQEYVYWRRMLPSSGYLHAFFYDIVYVYFKGFVFTLNGHFHVYF